MNPIEFNETRRQEILAEGERDFFLFSKGILGYDFLDRSGPIHTDLCAFLEGRPPHQPWNAAMVCGYRGSGKSTVVRAYITWRAFYIENFAAKIISNSAENAKQLHFLPIVDLLTTSPRAEFLQWLFQHRIPESPYWYNSQRIQLIKTDPNSAPTISYWGLDSKFEGWHGELVVLDDPEGADADRSDVSNEESYRTWQATIPLLKDQATGQRLLVATPHGHKPLVYRLRDREIGGHLDNTKRRTKIWWLPVLDERDEPYEPRRFPPHVIETLKLDRETWNSQYMLRRPGHGLELFDMGRVRESCFRWVHPKKVIEYPAFEFDLDTLDGDGFARFETVRKTINLQDCRIYLHVDPTHIETTTRTRNRRKDRPSEAAVVVVAVAPDNHAFLIDYWARDTQVEHLATEMFRLYRIYAPLRVTWEPVGAQAWLRSYIEALEKSDPRYQRVQSSGLVVPAMRLPKLSTRMVESERTTESKEAVFRSVLAGWINYGAFHFEEPKGPRGEKPLHQLENCLNDSEAVDLIDALCQGAQPARDEDRIVWQPPAEPDLMDRMRRSREFVDAFVTRKGNPHQPWGNLRRSGGWHSAVN